MFHFYIRKGLKDLTTKVISGKPLQIIIHLLADIKVLTPGLKGNPLLTSVGK